MMLDITKHGTCTGTVMHALKSSSQPNYDTTCRSTLTFKCFARGYHKQTETEF